MIDNRIAKLPDGSAFFTMSLPLPLDHWLYEKKDSVPPMPFRLGERHAEREQWERAIWAAGKYAVRCATMNGKETNFDPDALCQNLVVGLIGYHTQDGTSGDSWGNPDNLPTDGVVYADRDAIAERCEKLWEALRCAAIEYDTSAAMRCRLCSSSWEVLPFSHDPCALERHAEGCLAAPKEET